MTRAPEVWESLNRLETSASFMGRWKAPDYTIQRLLQRGMLYSLTGRSGAGKTLLLVQIAIASLTGEPFAGRKVKQGSVVLLAGENPDNFRTQWGAATQRTAGLTLHPNLYWRNGHFNLAAEMPGLLAHMKSIPDLVLVGVNSLQAFSGVKEENNNPELLEAARRFRQFALLPSRPMVVVTAHPTKNAGKEELVPRGASSFLNEIDGNLKLWRTGNVAALEPDAEKFRGEPFDPIKFEMNTVSILESH